MDNPYSKLNLSNKATSSEIEAAYRKISKIEHHIGDDTYDYYHRLLKAGEAQKAYKILSNRNKRFKYDLDHFNKVEYIDFDFKDESEIKAFTHTLLEEIYIQKSNVELKEKLIKGLDERVQIQLEKSIHDKTDFSIKLELERSKIYDLEKEKYDLLSEIVFLKSEIKSLNDVLKGKDLLINKKDIIENQNTRLIKIAKYHKNRIFKISTIIIFTFVFIIAIILINLP